MSSPPRYRLLTPLTFSARRSWPTGRSPSSVQQQAYQLESTRRALAATIVVASINAASLQEQVVATEQLVALGEQRARQIASRYELGSASRDEMLAAEQDAANAAATLPALRAQTLAVRHAQAVLLGRTPRPGTRATASGCVARARVSCLSRLRPIYCTSGPDILAAEAAVRATADEAGAATASMVPSLTLSAAYGRGGFDWSTFTSPAGAIWSVGAKLTQPIFHGGALVARKHQYEATLRCRRIAVQANRARRSSQNVADTLVSLEEDANALVQTRRAAAARASHAAGYPGTIQVGFIAACMRLSRRDSSTRTPVFNTYAHAPRDSPTPPPCSTPWAIRWAAYRRAAMRRKSASPRPATSRR